MAPARQKLLDAALALIREKGYALTTVDELCAKAGVAKGSFFHHFKDKEALAIAAANYWSEMTSALFEGAPYHKHKDPLDRVLSYIEFRKSILRGEVAEFTCFVGTMVQDVYQSNPAIRDARDASISNQCGEGRGRYRRSDEALPNTREVDGQEPRTTHAGCSARRLHTGQDQGRRRDRRCQRRSFAPLYRTFV